MKNLGLTECEPKETSITLADVLTFGPEGGETQKTLITDEPIIIDNEKASMLRELNIQVCQLIEEFDLNNQAETLGIDPQYFNDALMFDRITGSQMVYGGIDVYWNNGKPKVLEINARPQAMGFQDSRQGILGIEGQPQTIKQFAHFLKDSGASNVYILGSRKNPFWRGYELCAANLRNLGFDSKFGDAEQFTYDWGHSIHPDVIWRLTNSHFVLYDTGASKLREIALGGRIRFINSLSSQFMGDRGFLAAAGRIHPELFPAQLLLNSGNDIEQIKAHPWIKLETGREFSYVVNFGSLRKWGQDALLKLIDGNMNIDDILGDKTNRDAENIRRARDEIAKVPANQLKWVAQEEIEPEIIDVKCNKSRERLRILHRVYWVGQTDGEITTSFEAYGATDKQYSQSKGKINGGSGYAVPVVIG